MRNDGAHFRYYCPRCQLVACGMKRQGQWIVLPHYKPGWGAISDATCLGGEVDEREDRAP